MLSMYVCTYNVKLTISGSCWPNRKLISKIINQVGINRPTLFFADRPRMKNTRLGQIPKARYNSKIVITIITIQIIKITAGELIANL